MSSEPTPSWLYISCLHSTVPRDLETIVLGLQDLLVAGPRGNSNLHVFLNSTEPVGSLAGDANRDGVFDSSDLILVFQAGEYEDQLPGNSTFEEGDWNGDGDFDSGDLVTAFQAGHYVAAATPSTTRFVAFRLNADNDDLRGRKRVSSPHAIDEALLEPLIDSFTELARTKI